MVAVPIIYYYASLLCPYYVKRGEVKVGSKRISLDIRSGYVNIKLR